MSDPYYVYRPVIELIGHSEGTDKGRGYNETLSYGAYTGGPVDLVRMTLDQIDALQTKMLKHPKNKLRSSAVGRPQIIRTTLRDIRQKLGLTGKELYDEDMQDRLTCFLLGQRGIDKWLSGRLKLDTLLTNLAQEWASLPKPDGKGYYGGQRASVTVAQVEAALAEVKRRHQEGQPKVEVPVEVEKEVIPPEVEQEAKKVERNEWWRWPTALTLAGIGSFYRDYPELAWAATGGVAVIAVVALIGGRRFVRRVKDMADEARS